MENKWIRVEDELPENDLSVLVMLGEEADPPCRGVMMGRQSYGKWIATNSYGSSHTSKITHWQPLPEPPKKEGLFFTACPGGLAVDLSVYHTEHGFICKEKDEVHTRRVCNRLNKIWAEERKGK